MRLPPSNWSFFSTDPSDPNYDLSRTFLLTLFVVIITITVAGNILTLLVAFRRKPLQKSVSNLYVASLGVSDLLIGGVIMAPMLIYALAFNGRWPLSDLLCQSWQAADITISTVSLYNMCGIGFDRWWNIEKPLRVFKRNRKIAKRMILGIWLLPAIIWIPTFVALRSQAPESSNSAQCSFVWRPKMLVLLMAGPFLYVPVIVLIVLFVRISLVVKRHLKFREEHAHKRASLSQTVNGQSSRKCTIELTPQINKIDCKPSHSTPVTPVPGRITALELKSSSTPSTSPVAGSLRVIRHRLEQQQKEHLLQEQNKKHFSEPELESAPAPSKLSTSSGSRLRIPNDGLPYIDGPVLSDSAALFNAKIITEPARSMSTYSYQFKRSSSVRRMTQRLSSIQIPAGISELLHNEGVSQQIRATKTVVVISSCFLICWLPFLILWPIKIYCDQCVSNQIYLLAIWTNYLSSTLNPILYTLCSPTAKMALSSYFVPLRRTRSIYKPRLSSIIL